MPQTKMVLQLFELRGESQYGREAVTQLEHALQAATLAEHDRVTPELTVAALLHDIGHLLHDLPVNAPDKRIDDHHETAGQNFLTNLFPKAVTEPVRLHVLAKRYLCTVEPTYFDHLSGPSIVSLKLQGGLLCESEQAEFAANPHAEEAVRLRRWDDAAKVTGLKTPSLSHFETLIQHVISHSLQS